MSQHRRSRRPGRGKGGEAGTRRGERAHTGRANTEALPYSAGNSAQDPVTNHHGKESEKVCLTRSLGCATEMNTTQRCKRTPPGSSCLKKKVSQQRSEHSHGYLPVGREAEPGGVKRRCPRTTERQPEASHCHPPSESHPWGTGGWGQNRLTGHKIPK